MVSVVRACIVPLVLAIVGTACGAGSTAGEPSDASAADASPSNDGNTNASPNAYVDSSLFAFADLGAQVCGASGAPWLEVGASDASANDGSTQGGFTVSVGCSVTANSDGSFAVNALASDGSIGSVGVIGTMMPSGTQSGIHGEFTRGDTGSFASSECTVSFTMEAGMGVAAGRVWGYMECPDVVDSAVSELAPDGAAVSRTCAAAATFKFQNCSE